MAEGSVVIVGLPSSGKTTFLAALWHLITERDIETKLRFGDLLAGNTAHLNAIATRWRDAKVQERTAVTGSRVVSMNLINGAGQTVRVAFPDLPGEVFQQMWEDRDCELGVAQMLQSGSVLLFVHSDTIRAPGWVVDEVAQSKAMGIEVPKGKAVPWHPRLAPTQVQLVELLQLLRRPPLNIGPRRLAIMLSAWDTARAEGMTPTAYLDAKLPLLAQYLRRGADGWTWRVYGLSAQGGEYDPIEENAKKVPEAEELRNLDNASERIVLIGPEAETHDVTEPLEWLMT
jgi:GTPase SAR1 family protein